MSELKINEAGSVRFRWSRMPPRSAGPRSRPRSPSRSAAAKRHAVPRRAGRRPLRQVQAHAGQIAAPEWSEAVYTENAADAIDRPLVAELQLSPERETFGHCSKRRGRTRKF